MASLSWLAQLYAGYSRLLTSATGYANKIQPGEAWDDSVAGNLLKLHEKELGLIRYASANYRELLLRNYTCIRGQAKTSFWNDKLSKKMALVTTRALSQATISPGGVSAGTGTGGAVNRNYCDICRRTHQGRPCAVASFTAAERTRGRRCTG